MSMAEREFCMRYILKGGFDHSEANALIGLIIGVFSIVCVICAFVWWYINIYSQITTTKPSLQNQITTTIANKSTTILNITPSVEKTTGLQIFVIPVIAIIIVLTYSTASRR